MLIELAPWYRHTAHTASFKAYRLGINLQRTLILRWWPHMRLLHPTLDALTRAYAVLRTMHRLSSLKGCGAEHAERCIPCSGWHVHVMPRSLRGTRFQACFCDSGMQRRRRKYLCEHLVHHCVHCRTSLLRVEACTDLLALVHAVCAEQALCAPLGRKWNAGGLRSIRRLPCRPSEWCWCRQSAPAL